MKLTKKLFVLALALVAGFVLVGCQKGDKQVLVVGTPEMNGDFVSGFGSSAYDVNVRDLLHGYGTLVETEFGEFVWDTEAVLEAAPTTEVDADGNKTYTFKLQDDLEYNTGEKITAEDYVAYILLYSSKDWTSIATSALAGYYLVGYELYNKGESTGVDEDDEPTYDEDYTVLNEVFTGVRLLGEYEFSLTIDEGNLPYFYETTMVSAAPIDVETYLPGFAIKDDGEGAYITDVDAAGNISEVIAISVNNTKTGQRYKPTVTAGPYQFVSFVNQIAIVELNPNFKVNYEGKKPTIDEVHVMYINQDTDVDQVIAGTVDIVSGVIEGDKIEAARNSDTAELVSYARNGYGLIAFACYYGPTQYAEVRRAVGYLFDRNVFLNEFLGGYGTLVNGPYGEAQWFYQETKDELNSQLTNYTLDIDKANAELDASDYTFESDGVTPWDVDKASTTYFRYNDKKEMLEINHLGTTNNQVTTLIGLQVAENAWKAGIKYTVTEAGFDVLLDNYYYGYGLEAEDRKYHSFNLASNFYSDYDPYWSWHTDLAGTTNNPGAISDPTVMDPIMEEMQGLEPTNKERFKELFVDFVVRWNELLPNLPLYSNEYFDVYNVRVSGLQSTPVWSWSDDICDIRIAE